MAEKKILIVDDNLMNLKLMKVLLTVEGYDVRTAVDAAEALNTLTTFMPQLILMDIQLPDMDGLALTCRLRADPHYKSTIILAVTAYAMKGDEEKALSAGCDGYITKPIDTHTFPGMIASYLE